MKPAEEWQQVTDYNDYVALIKAIQADAYEQGKADALKEFTPPLLLPAHIFAR